MDERGFEFPFEEHRGAERLRQLLVGVDGGYDLDHVRPARFDFPQVFEHLFGGARTLHVRGDHDPGSPGMDLCNQLFLAVDGGRVPGQLHRGGIVEVPHDVDHRGAGGGGLQQQLLPLLIVPVQLHVVAVEAEHEGEIH